MSDTDSYQAFVSLMLAYFCIVPMPKTFAGNEFWSVSYIRNWCIRGAPLLAREQSMPKFHFDLVDARMAAEEEEDARFCNDEEEAQVLAKTIANRLATSEPSFLRGYCVLVSDTNGVEIYRAALGARQAEPGE